MQKYDFEAPDIKQAVDSHKPNFVNAEKRVFEKSDGDQSDEQEKESEKKKKDSFKKVSRDEWNNMTKAEKKKYLKERKKSQRSLENVHSIPPVLFPRQFFSSSQGLLDVQWPSLFLLHDSNWNE